MRPGPSQQVGTSSRQALPWSTRSWTSATTAQTGIPATKEGPGRLGPICLQGGGMPSNMQVRYAGRPLTPRDIEVMELVAEGHSNPSIAQQLGIKPETVTKFVARVFVKLHFTSRIELAAAVWQKRHEAEIAKIHQHYMQSK